jgi:hypothetical protein
VKLTYELSHPIGASEKVRQLTRIRIISGLRVEYYNDTTEANIMKKGKKVAILRKESLLGPMPKKIWVAYTLDGKRMYSSELHEIKQLLKKLSQDQRVNMVFTCKCKCGKMFDTHHQLEQHLGRVQDQTKHGEIGVNKLTPKEKAKKSKRRK